MSVHFPILQETNVDLISEVKGKIFYEYLWKKKLTRKAAGLCNGSAFICLQCVTNQEICTLHCPFHVYTHNWHADINNNLLIIPPLPIWLLLCYKWISTNEGRHPVQGVLNTSKYYLCSNFILPIVVEGLRRLCLVPHNCLVPNKEGMLSLCEISGW